MCLCTWGEREMEGEIDRNGKIRIDRFVLFLNERLEFACNVVTLYFTSHLSIKAVYVTL